MKNIRKTYRNPIGILQEPIDNHKQTEEKHKTTYENHFKKTCEDHRNQLKHICKT